MLQRAKAIRHCLAETDCGRKVATTTNVTRVSMAGALGAADWTAAQTEHFADSIALEGPRAADAVADQKVSKTHSNATASRST